jgi:pyruvate-formate lyase
MKNLLRLALGLATLVTVVTTAGCGRHRATPLECRAILDRLVQLELKESGYRDPNLVVRWQRELGDRFETELRACGALRVRDNLLSCLASAQDPEQVAHQCLN